MAKNMFKREGEEGMMPMNEPMMADEMETIIGPSVQVEGNFVSNGNIIVEGSVKGTIQTTRDLRIGEGAIIEAEVRAENISSSGQITGSVFANQRLELKQTGKIFGDVEAGILSVETGAVLQGKCTSGHFAETPEQPIQEEPTQAELKTKRGSKTTAKEA